MEFPRSDVTASDCFDSPWCPKWQPWVYVHELVIEAGGVASLRRSSKSYGLPFDVALLSMVVSAMFRASAVRGREGHTPPARPMMLPITLYAPMRDGELNDAMIGLFSDFRDLTFPCGSRQTVLGLCVEVAETIRHRRWQHFDAMSNSERILVNILPLDEHSRGERGFRQTRFHEYGDRRLRPARERRSQKQHYRPMRITLEQESPTVWWISMDINSNRYPTAWCRRFVHELRRTWEDLAQRPLEAVLPEEIPTPERPAA